MKGVVVPLGITLLVPAVLTGIFGWRMTTSLLVVVCIFVGVMMYAVVKGE